MPDEDYSHHREDDPPECFTRHVRWQRKWWREEGVGKVRTIMIGVLSGAVVVSGIVMVFIADYKVNAADHATTSEVKELETELKIVITEAQRQHEKQMEAVNRKVDEGFRDTERRLDTLMNVILTIPGARPVP